MAFKGFCGLSATTKLRNKHSVQLLLNSILETHFLQHYRNKVFFGIFTFLSIRIDSEEAARGEWDGQNCARIV